MKSRIELAGCHEGKGRVAELERRTDGEGCAMSTNRTVDGEVLVTRRSGIRGNTGCMSIVLARLHERPFPFRTVAIDCPHRHNAKIVFLERREKREERSLSH